MKFQKMIRTQLMLMGLGVVLVLASSARAQQDMDPSSFDINPGTPKVERHAGVRTAHNSEPAEKVSTEAVVPAALWSRQNTREEADFSRLIIVDAAMVLILMAGITSIVFYAMAATRRERRFQFSPANALYRPASGATTH
jgi:hypothetical protein